MDASAIKEKIRPYLLKQVKAPNLADDQDYFKAGFVNSLFAMQLVLFVEKEFQIAVEDDDLVIENFNSVNAITGLVLRKTGQA